MALNTVIIMGRITHDLEIKQTQSGIASLRFSIAVDRCSKDDDKKTDFINCVAYRNTAEFIGKYFGKGRMIAITGNLHTYNYDDSNGVKRYVTEVIVDSADFTGEPKPAQNLQGGAYGGGSPQGYNYAPQSAPPPQRAPQSVTAASPNGYPNSQMYAPQKNKPMPDTSADFADFEVFSEDGVPF